MMHPVGSRPPAVYWRRRLLLIAAVVTLAAITAWVLRPGGAKTQAAVPTTHTVSNPAPSPADKVVSPSRSSPAPSTSALSSPGSSKASQPATLAACSAANLKVSAVVAQPNYAVGTEPVVMLQVINGGPLPCVQNVADSQIELRVYNGESRVWGSHDCEIQPGIDARTLAVGQPVRISVTWSGLSSQPDCAGTRQRVGAGTYTLYALLSGRLGTAAQFSIS